MCYPVSKYAKPSGKKKKNENQHFLKESSDKALISNHDIWNLKEMELLGEA